MLREKLSKLIEARAGHKPMDIAYWEAVDEPDSGRYPKVFRIAAGFDESEGVDLVIIGSATILEGDLIIDSFTDFTRAEFKQIIDTLNPVL